MFTVNENVYTVHRFSFLITCSDSSVSLSCRDKIVGESPTVDALNCHKLCEVINTVYIIAQLAMATICRSARSLSYINSDLKTYIWENGLEC